MHYARLLVLTLLVPATVAFAASRLTLAQEPATPQANRDDSTLGAQEPQPGAAPEDAAFEGKDWRFRRGAKEYSLEFGFAPGQPTFLSGHKEYDTTGRKLALASLRFGRVLGTVKGVTYQYLFEAMPMSLAIGNEIRNPGYDPRTSPKGTPAKVRETTYGVGIMPAGFRFIFKPKSRVKPYLQLGAGFIFSAKPIPVPGSPHYNFAGDFGGGLMYSFTRRRTMNVGFRYFHISNMNMGELNPGYNASVFTLGYSFFSK